jgi:hypothetical protein
MSRTSIPAVASFMLGSLLILGGCSEPECPDGFFKVGKICKRIDAGADEDRAAASTVDGSANNDNDAVGTGHDAGSNADAASQTDDVPSSQQAQDAAGTASVQASDAGVVTIAPTADAGISPGPDASKACVPSDEVCDGVDNDCDGRVDEDKRSWYCDADGDGFAANASGKTDSCEKPPASATCGSWTTKAPSEAGAQDCDDKSALRFPGAGFGLSAGPSGDLNCNGMTETKLEFVESSVPGYYSDTTPLNICMHAVGDLFGGTAAGECDCWYSSAIGKGFVGLVNGSATFSGTNAGTIPYFMRTFSCAEDSGEVIMLWHAGKFGAECMQGEVMVVARQLCR